ncbi:ATP-binding cassette domain-containing protein [Halomonas sp. AOP35-4E-18]|uniref:ATP-binding cassette domain-containing protein n=1 Tax=Halomonas sp. AOP35-4E-18 TaxID=3457686 RepID=UPI004033AF59
MTVLARLRSLPVDCRLELRHATLWAGVAAMLDAACGLLLVPLLESWFAEGVVPWGWLALIFGATLLQSLVVYAALRRGYLAGGRLAFGLVRRLIEQLPRLSPPALRRVVLPEGLLRGPVQHSMGIPAHLLGPLVGAVVTPATVVVGLLFINPSIACGLLLAGGLLVMLMRWSGRCNLEVEATRLHAEREFSKQLQTFAEHQPLLRASNHAGAAQQRLEDALGELHASSHRLLSRGLPASLAFSLAVQATFALVLLGGAWAVAQQILEGERLVAVLILLVRFIEPMAQLTHLDQALRGAWQALDTLLKVFELPALNSPEGGQRPQDSGLRAEALGYDLDDGRALLSNIDFSLAPGTLSVIVGPSGAGKSSLLSLLGRLYDPDRGKVRLGGVDARWLDEGTLAASRHFVFQASGLFRGSVAWNLRMAKADADIEELRAAAASASLLAEIESWPQGWETEVGPGGGLLSGGQRQRLCLARAFLSPAPLLLLDEPTASLDALSEKRLRQSLEALRGVRTVLAVTHSPALACLADQVLVLENGRLRLCGRHYELGRQDAWYARFANTERTSMS